MNPWSERLPVPEQLPSEEYHIELGEVYECTSTIPPGCKGHHYTVVAFATLVPVYQPVVVVQALTGPDVGRTIVCSHANFASRYNRIRRIPKPIPPLESTEVGHEVDKWRSGA